MGGGNGGNESQNGKLGEGLRKTPSRYLSEYVILRERFDRVLSRQATEGSEFMLRRSQMARRCQILRYASLHSG